MMVTEKIIKILSNHRQPHCLERPQSLTLRSIASLVEHSLPPNHAVTSDQIQEYLQELQAQGEVLAGVGNRFCMAPPVVLAEDPTNLSGVLFKGDRAYLKWAHQALKTGQSVTKTHLHPKVHSFHRIKESLKNQGIRLLTVTDSVEHLPIPEKPKLYLLAGAEWYENPFQSLQESGSIQAYMPKSQWQTQGDRWQCITQADLASDSLLKLSTGEYLWFEAGQVYELSPDVAALTLFWLDQQAGLPLRVAWDRVPGRLNLQGISLPSSYAQWLWRLSKSDPVRPRTRLFEPSQRAIACQALTQLRCTLV
ncbi:MAG: hypothetical protein N4J56_006285 [Chroococcidiopsis sp. SAG 2025]|uniref:hypothetical protein n=1 Tax=Chroococcidiopsis sp. SAG 2025 TaxID=171389 RepID=UPI00293713E6|nr:hypothetical protein [Chroococcidiopsis sp. SAG 2025]MDV2996631.1 hypothetical protein [Chroococcidiopsis sp. SAG 2025]